MHHGITDCQRIQVYSNFAFGKTLAPTELDNIEGSAGDIEIVDQCDLGLSSDNRVIAIFIAI